MSQPLTPFAGLTSAGVQLVKTANYISTNAGNPNGLVAGQSGSASTAPDQIWDYQNGILYVCTTGGTAATTVWSPFNYPGSLGVAGNVTIGGTLFASSGSFNGITNTGTLAQSGAATFSNTLSVAGTASKFLVNPGSAAGALDNVVIGGTTPLAVTSTTLTNTGNVTLTGTASVLLLNGGTAGLTLSGTGSNINLAGNMTVGSSLSMTGAIVPNATAGILGATSGTVISSGYVGQVQTASGTVVGTGGTISNICSLVLTAGNYDASGNASVIGTGTLAGFDLGVGTVSAAMPTVVGGAAVNLALLGATGNNTSTATPNVPLNVSSTTTVYLTARPFFSGGTESIIGFLRVRRMI